MNGTPRFAYVLAIILGFAAAIAPANLPLQTVPLAVALLVSATIFALAGALCGALWPRTGARWGFWIVAPGLFFITLGVISDGNFTRFLTDDLPYVVAGLIGASVGAAVGAKMRGPSSDS